MDYIKLYEAETKRKVKKGYDIHHIDKNRNNNSILNLVALIIEIIYLVEFQIFIILIFNYGK